LEERLFKSSLETAENANYGPFLGEKGFGSYFSATFLAIFLGGVLQYSLLCVVYVCTSSYYFFSVYGSLKQWENLI